MGRLSKTVLRGVYVFVLALLPAGLLAQTTTRDAGKETTTDNTPGKTHVLIVPWNPKLFNADPDVSRAMSKETGQKYDQIQYAFSRGIIDQIKKQFGSGYAVTSLLDDTAAMKKDLQYVFEVSGGEWIPVNAPLNPAPKVEDPKKKTPPNPNLKNGQLQTQEQEGEKFMNAAVFSPNLLGYLKKKYNADYVIFLNQFDLGNDLGSDPYNIQQRTDYKRKAILHWTIFSSSTGKRVAMGKTSATFVNTLNSPKKIIETIGPVLGKAILLKYTTAPKP
jgi:hypothetical protein